MTPRLVFVAAGVLFWSGAAAAQQQPTLTAAMDTGVIHLGQPFTLRLSLNHEAADSVVWPTEAAAFQPFEVVSSREATNTLADGRLNSTAEYRLTVFELGEVAIPELPVAVRRADGSELTLSSGVIEFEVESAGIDESGDIRDIKPPVSIPRNWLLLWPWLLVLALAAAGAWWLGRRLRRPPEGAVFPAAPARPAHHVALAALDELERENLPARGRMKEFHVRLSEIIRVYVDGRWGIDALDMTTEDLLPKLARTDIESEENRRIGDLLQRCDLVKFAKHDPGAVEAAAALEDGRAAVRNTNPVATEEAA